MAASGFEQFLLRQEVLDAARLERARAEAAKNGLSLLAAVVQMGYLPPEKAYEALAQFCEMRFVLPSKMAISPDLVGKVPARFATHYGFVPVQERDGLLVVAVSDPLNAQLLDDIRLVLKRRIEAVVTTPQEIARVTRDLYGVGADTMEKMLISAAEGAEGVVNLESSQASSDLGDDSIDASIIKFVNELILEAIQSDTTDIHIEPFEEALRVRYRIDGILHQAPTPPSIRGFHSAIVSRMKAAGIDVIYLGGYHTEGGLIVRQAKEQGMNVTLIGGDALVTNEFWQISGAAGEGTLMTFSSDPRRRPTAAEVVQRFRARNVDPEGYVLYTYAAIQIFADAAKKANSTDPRRLAALLKSDGPWQTVLGPISFTPKGDVTVPDYVFYVWRNGAYAELS